MTADVKAFLMEKDQGGKQDLVFPDRKTNGIRKQIS